MKTKVSVSLIHLGLPFLTLVLGSCAMEIVSASSEFVPVPAATLRQPKTIAKQADIKLDTGYSRSLKVGSQWLQVGTIPEGNVYKAYGAVFTIEGAHVHEAYLVVAGDRLVGFYLPVDHGFSPLSRKTDLVFH